VAESLADRIEGALALAEAVLARPTPAGWRAVALNVAAVLERAKRTVIVSQEGQDRPNRPAGR
jgi:hypothetical protein